MVAAQAAVEAAAAEAAVEAAAAEAAAAAGAVQDLDAVADVALVAEWVAGNIAGLMEQVGTNRQHVRERTSVTKTPRASPINWAAPPLDV